MTLEFEEVWISFNLINAIYSLLIQINVKFSILQIQDNRQFLWNNLKENKH